MMPPQRTFCLSMNHDTAHVAMRETVRCEPEELLRVLKSDSTLKAAISEWAILSTCNRYELFVHMDAHADARRTLISWLQRVRPLDLAEIDSHFVGYCDEEAVVHLLRVASGLDSQVLGEPQVLGQVSGAFMKARALGTLGPYLTRLFQAAIRAGKRARTETAIGRFPSSIGSVAVSHIEARSGPLTDRSVVVIGAGEMAELSVSALRKRGLGSLSIVNRTSERAHKLLGMDAGRIYRLDQLYEAMLEADAVISATSAPHPILASDLVASVCKARGGRPLLLVDIAVPHDIEPDVAVLPGVTVINLDMLNDRLEAARQARLDEVPAVEALVAEELARWQLAVRELYVEPVIRDLRQKAETIRQKQVERALKNLRNLDPATREQIDRLSQSLINQLLHEPTIRLKDEAGSTSAGTLAAAVQTLFNLDPE